MKKMAVAGLIGLLLAGGLILAGCKEDEGEAEKGGTLTVTNTSSDQYSYEFLDRRGQDLDWGTLYAYRSETFRGHQDGVHEFRYRKSKDEDWVKKYGNLSGGQKATMNIP